jgi:hypothetical protein
MQRRDLTTGCRAVGKYAGGSAARCDNTRTAADRSHQNIMATARRSNAAERDRPLVSLQAVSDNTGVPPKRRLAAAVRRNEATLAAMIVLRCLVTYAFFRRLRLWATRPFWTSGNPDAYKGDKALAPIRSVLAGGPAPLFGAPSLCR